MAGVFFALGDDRGRLLDWKSVIYALLYLLCLMVWWWSRVDEGVMVWWWIISVVGVMLWREMEWQASWVGDEERDEGFRGFLCDFCATV